MSNLIFLILVISLVLLFSLLSSFAMMKSHSLESGKVAGQRAAVVALRTEGTSHAKNPEPDNSPLLVASNIKTDTSEVLLHSKPHSGFEKVRESIILPQAVSSSENKNSGSVQPAEVIMPGVQNEVGGSSPIKNRISISKGNTVNVFEDVWTCSDEMRDDIAQFFLDKSHYKIVEIGAHKGYTTKILSKIFAKVYAVDNDLQWTEFSKKFNADSSNIEFAMFDIYKDRWEDGWGKLPEDIQVAFLDAGHEYEACKTDIINSIKRFNDLRYLIFDDYGIRGGVKKAIHEFLANKTFVFETYIGLNDVPGPSGKIRKGIHEGVIVRLNKPSL